MRPSVTVGIAAAFSFLAGAATLAAKERTVRCYISVDGRAYLDQDCIFDAEEDGSFSIGTAGENGTIRMPFYAYVNKNPDGTADGSWNEDASSAHAQAPLGVLKRTGACWTNKRARICAY